MGNTFQNDKGYGYLYRVTGRTRGAAWCRNGCTNNGLDSIRFLLHVLYNVGLDILMVQN